MQQFVGVEDARARLGRLAEEVSESDQAVFLTRRGTPIAVLISRAEYERLQAIRRRVALDALRSHLSDIRQAVIDGGLDVSLGDDAIRAARAAE